jgi:hypothetical protein
MILTTFLPFLRFQSGFPVPSRFLARPRLLNR